MMTFKSNAALLKWVDPKLFGCFALVAFHFSLILFLAVGIGDGYFQRQLCFGAGCWEEFVRLFSLPFGLAILSAKFLVAYSAAVGILVAVNNYTETKRVASSQVHLANRAFFESFVMDRLSKLNYLDASNVSVHEWYAFMCPESAQGDLTVSKEYLDSLEEIGRFVAKTDIFIRKTGRGYRHDRYHGPVIRKLKGFGFDLSGCSRLEFFSLEREAYSLLNDANAVFCSRFKHSRLAPSQAHGIP